MNRIRRHIMILATLAASMLVLGSVPAFAERVPPGGISDDLPIVSQHTAPAQLAASGGIAGWEVTLIAVGAAVLAAVLAVLLDRARRARHESPHAA